MSPHQSCAGNIRQGLRVGGCGMRVSGWLPLAGTLGLCVRGSGVESPAVDGDSPVPEDMWLGCVRIFSRVAAGSWNLL